MPPVTSARGTAGNRRAGVGAGARWGCLTFGSIIAPKVKHLAQQASAGAGFDAICADPIEPVRAVARGLRAGLVPSASAPAGFRPSLRGGRRQLGGCGSSSSVTGGGPSHPWGVVSMPAGLGPPMVRRVVARRVYPDRRPSWADVLTHGQWKALRPAFRADRPLQSECRAVFLRLPASERPAFIAALTMELGRRRRPPQALGLAVEAAARRALGRSRSRPLLGRSDRRQR